MKTAVSSRKYPRNNLDQSFPEKLMDILSLEITSHIITWLPHGKSFIFLDQDQFAQDLIPSYFGKCQFASFLRKLYRWGFRQIVKGPDAGSYFHPLFQRDNRPLCKFLTCNKNEALSGANAITHLDNQEVQTDSETTTSTEKTTGQAISPLTQVSATCSSNHQPIIGYQGVPANDFNREDQVNTLHAPLYFNQVNQSLYHATTTPQSCMNKNLPQSLSLCLSILNNNIRREKNLLQMKMLFAQHTAAQR